MKKAIFILLIAGAISCDSNKKTEEVESSENAPGVENVNGNMPDTTNSINLDDSNIDSSMVDSLKK